MAVSNKVFDVFISHAVADLPMAEEIATACRTSGLSAFLGVESLRSKDWGDVLWEALSESQAMIAILSPSAPTPSMAVEIGAARAWNKPVFGLVTDPTMKLGPIGLAGMHLYTLSGIEDVIGAIRRSGQEFSDNDRAALASLFADIDLSLDELTLDPSDL